MLPFKNMSAITFNMYRSKIGLTSSTPELKSFVYYSHFSNLLCTKTKATIPQDNEEGLNYVSSLKGNCLENEQ